MENPRDVNAKTGRLREALSNKLTWIFAAFIFGYVGAEGNFPFLHITKLQNINSHHSITRRLDRNLYDPSSLRHNLFFLPHLNRFLGRYDGWPHRSRFPDSLARRIHIRTRLPWNLHSPGTSLLAHPILLRFRNFNSIPGIVPRPLISNSYCIGYETYAEGITCWKYWVCDCVWRKWRSNISFYCGSACPGEGSEGVATGCFGALGDDLWIVDVGSEKGKER